MITGAELYRDDSYVVYINGSVIGVTRFPVRFVQSFRRLRRAGRFSEFVSIYTNSHHRAVHIASDGGRICRPMIIVENGQSKVTSEHIRQLKARARTFDDFLTDGLIEYLDVNEENDSYIALYESEIIPVTTHLEIEPFTLLGAVAGLIPYVRCLLLRRVALLTFFVSAAASQPVSEKHSQSCSLLLAVHCLTHRAQYQCAMGKQAIGAIAYNQVS
jgi:DNA-directed RNA polymerase III subunit RPC2